MELSDYYKQVEARKLESSEPEPPRSGMYRDELDKKDNPGQKMMYLKSEEQSLAAETRKLDTLMNRAKAGASGAFQEIMDLYGKEEPPIMAVRVDSNLVDAQGRLVVDGVAHEKFGAKEIADNKEKEQLTRDVEKAKQYLPSIELTEIMDKEGARIAIVTGAEVKEFNAVMRIERERAELGAQAQLLAQEKKQELGNMGLHMDVALTGGATTKEAGTYVSTPAVAPDRSKVAEVA